MILSIILAFNLVTFTPASDAALLALRLLEEVVVVALAAAEGEGPALVAILVEIPPAVVAAAWSGLYLQETRVWEGRKQNLLGRIFFYQKIQEF